MIKNILPIIAAAILSATFIFAFLSYIKPRRSQADFIMGLLNSISKSYDKEDR